MENHNYDKQLLVIGLAISLSLFGLLIAAIIHGWYFETKPAEKLTLTSQTMFLKSPDFKNNEMMPGKLTCDGINTNPELIIAGVPTEAVSLALIAYDPDATGGWTHWVLWNIPPTTEKILADTIPTGAIVGKNDFGQNNYGGPCPPSGTHHYIFTLYAIDTTLELPATGSRAELLAVMEGHMIDMVELTGMYGR